MYKGILISEIVPKLDQMGIAYTQGQGTDVAIACEFLDAGWGTGNKKIDYTSSVYFDESESTVYMWELTKEIGSGFSFGGDSETSFQSGTTLFRKVKSVHYGPDGKAYEYNLDLGAIPKAFKETAKTHGWKFKTVLKRDKASYPPGYIPPDGAAPQQTGYTPVPPINLAKQSVGRFCSNCGAPLPESTGICKKCGKHTEFAAVYQPQQTVAASQPQYSNPQGSFYTQSKAHAPKNKSAAISLTAIIFLGVIAVLLFALMSTSIKGWIIGGVIFAAFVFLQQKLVKKGCILSIILWLITAFLLFLTLTFTSAPVNNSPNNGGSGDSTIAAKLPYKKDFPLNDGKSTGTFKLFISDGTGMYKDYKGKIICDFSVKFDTKSLPSDFKLKPEQAAAKNASGEPALDGLIMAVCSDTKAYHKSSLSYAAYIYNNGNLRPFVETNGCTMDVDTNLIKEIAAKYPLMQVLRYNENEVGMTKSGNTWTTHSEKAFGLHPPVAEANIPWNEILSDLGLK